MTDRISIQATGRFYREMYVVGDIHGSLQGLEEILRHANLVNGNGSWNGRRGRVVQCGDVVDRGPASHACMEWLLKLRMQARKSGGGVDILIGNHELALARKDYSMTDVPDPEALGELIAKEIRRGRLHAARAYRHYLITHAGVVPALMKQLVREVRERYRQRVTVAAIARLLNQKLKDAFVDNDFSHPMFHVGVSRGGSNEYGGIFWADFHLDHDFKARHPKVWQVFGHTPPDYDGQLFRVSPDERRVNIDVGICENYGGQRAYVKLLPGHILGIDCHGNPGEYETLTTTDSAVTV